MSEQTGVPPDADNPTMADEPDPAFDETDDEAGETSEPGEPEADDDS